MSTALPVLSERDSQRMHRAALRRTRRNEHLQACVARGNTVLLPTYRELHNGRGDVVAQVYLGHRARFGARMQSPLMDNVTRIRVGRNVSDDVIDVLVDAARGRKIAKVHT